jgi:hypothetical protein
VGSHSTDSKFIVVEERISLHGWQQALYHTQQIRVTGHHFGCADCLARAKCMRAYKPVMFCGKFSLGSSVSLFIHRIIICILACLLPPLHPISLLLFLLFPQLHHFSSLFSFSFLKFLHVLHKLKNIVLCGGPVRLLICL